jgi:protein gp37
MENSAIEWTDHTFNPVVGCQPISPGCAHCYAKAMVERYGRDFSKRARTSAENWKKPLRWNRQIWQCDGCGSWRFLDSMLTNLDGTPKNTTPCLKCKRLESLHLRRPKVFCASMADWLDDAWPIEVLADLLKLIHDTPNLDWLLLTKRPENWSSRTAAVVTWIESFVRQCGDSRYLPTLEWLKGWKQGVPPANVWIGTTVENQEWADRRIPELLKIPAKVRFLSCEPLLEPVDLAPALEIIDRDELGLTDDPLAATLLQQAVSEGRGDCARMISWVICGGESGQGDKIRPMHPDWARSLRDQCQAAGVPFFFKQHGEWAPAAREHGVVGSVMPDTGEKYRWIGWDGKTQNPSSHGLAEPILAIARVGKKAAGRLLDGREWSQFPESK